MDLTSVVACAEIMPGNADADSPTAVVEDCSSAAVSPVVVLSVDSSANNPVCFVAAVVVLPRSKFNFCVVEARIAPTDRERFVASANNDGRAPVSVEDDVTDLAIAANVDDDVVVDDAFGLGIPVDVSICPSDAP